MLKGADLDKVTPKTVRISLENEFKTSFDSRKKEINEIIGDIINESSSSSEDEIEDMNPIKKKMKIETKSPPSKEPSKSEQAISSSSDDDDDEAIARRLQEEEMGSIRRTRSGNKTSGKKKSTKKKSKNGTSSRKPGGGYMKPLALSPELADFTGQSEVKFFNGFYVCCNRFRYLNLSTFSIQEFPSLSLSVLHDSMSNPFLLFQMPRHAVVKRVWDYCKENNLMVSLFTFRVTRFLRRKEGERRKRKKSEGKERKKNIRRWKQTNRRDEKKIKREVMKAREGKRSEERREIGLD